MNPWGILPALRSKESNKFVSLLASLGNKDFFMLKKEYADDLLNIAIAHVGATRKTLTDELSVVRDKLAKMEKEFRTAQGAERIVLDNLIHYYNKQAHSLEELILSPYFARCDLANTQGVENVLRFAKFSFPQENIYSWVAPAAKLRFENLGQVSYQRPDKKLETGDLIRKDQFMIKDGKILFFATEDKNTPRTLVYQEKFSTRKTGFVLPEIVERMEKAQDEIIRASWRGPLVISGPAGSGKTTLALHRVAYLMQVPEISDNFPPHKVQVFVQDTDTKSYFGNLLPELGIEKVSIITFNEWAKNILGINSDVEQSIIMDEKTRDILELEKLAILRSCREKINGKPVNWIKEKYNKEIQTNKHLVMENISRGIFDHIDLTILLEAYKRTHGTLHETKEYLIQHKNFRVTRKQGRFAPLYGLCVVDEFQNYLPEQLRLIKSCMDEATQSLVYVGDMKQQVKFGTIRSWAQIGENLLDNRIIKLSHVYRNTKEILRYIQSLGYEVMVPEMLVEGEKVDIYNEQDETKILNYVSSIIENASGALVGILAKNKSALESFESLVQKYSNIKVMTINEAQGVEFDTVILVGNNADTWRVKAEDYPESVIYEEKKRINQDLLYVALTRAIRKLCIIGDICA